jgi:tRNA(fMet)-specific endonuclease VapC
MWVLDTNHVSELTFRSTAGLRLLHRLNQTEGECAVTAITVEESIRGWLGEIRRHTEVRKQIPSYRRLILQVEIFASWQILPWDDAAADRFEIMNNLRQTVGTQDLKIAAICLDHDATLLTRNRRDFEKVPGLKIENWLD